MDYVNDCIHRSDVSYRGYYTKKFEEKLSDYTGAYAIATNTGTSALDISLKELNLPKESEILLPAISFIATANVIIYNGLIPNFIEIDKNLNIDTAFLKEFLKMIVKYVDNKPYNKFTNRFIAGIMPAHLFGNACDIEAIIEIAKEYKLKVIEDSCQAIGTRVNGRHVGTFGNYGALSFNGNKLITTGGGGSVLTKSKKKAERIKHLITTAKIFNYKRCFHVELGYNYAMPAINAAYGLKQLENIDSILDRYKKQKELNIKQLKDHNIDFEVIESNGNNWMTVVVTESDLTSLNYRQVWSKFYDIPYMQSYPSSDIRYLQSVENKIWMRENK